MSPALISAPSQRQALHLYMFLSLRQKLPDVLLALCSCLQLSAAAPLHVAAHDNRLNIFCKALIAYMFFTWQKNVRVLRTIYCCWHMKQWQLLDDYTGMEGKKNPIGYKCNVFNQHCLISTTKSSCSKKCSPVLPTLLGFIFGYS